MDEPAAAATVSNVPEYGVAELSGAIKRTLEGAFGRVRVRGEVTEAKRYPSGHIYFSLKEENAKLSAVVWKFAVARLGLMPENGVEVIASGKLSTYGDRSSYQLVVDRIEYAGIGALLARIEATRVRLAAEGLFNADRKRAIPLLPTVIGVVTSERGAVIQDIRTTIERRFPRRILLWPVPVQGEGAADKIAAAIRGFDALVHGGDVPRPDVLIVARGGGSLEDLMAFNEEVVLRAAADCTIPLISAVGHETDTTLIDFVSDRRAPTPTAAAEMAVPVRAELAADLGHTAARLLGALNRVVVGGRLALRQAEHGLPDLPALLGTARQRIDDRIGRLSVSMPNYLAARRASLLRAERGLPDPVGLARAARQRLDATSRAALLALPALLAARRGALSLAAGGLRAGLRQAVGGQAARAARITHRMSDAPLRAQIREARARLEGLAARLESVSHTQVLARGYALVFDGDGHPLTSAAAVRPASGLRLRFGDGEVRATAAGRRESRQGALPL